MVSNVALAIQRSPLIMDNAKCGHRGNLDKMSRIGMGGFQAFFTTRVSSIPGLAQLSGRAAQAS